jgi:pyruvate dehydrogenase E2 component (dihydrolipoamide acetyltransferase)
MPVSVTMPRLGESVTEGTVTRWLKQEGDHVEADEPLLEVSTDKVDTEIPSPAAGVLTRIVVGEDETVEVGSELAVIGDGDGGSASAPAQEEAPQQEEAPAQEEAAPAPAEEAQQSEPEEAPAPAPAPTQSSTGTAEGTAVKMPALGESVTEGTVTRWLKQVGESVEADEPLLEVSTDKVDTEIPSPVAGTLLEIKVPEDETVEVGADLAVIGAAGAAPAQQSAPAKEAAPQQEAPKQEAPKQEAQPAPAKQQPAPATAGASYATPTPEAEASGKVESRFAPAPTEQAKPAETDGNGGDPAGYVTPLVRKLAGQHGVDLSSVRGTGVGGRIRKQDVLEAAERKKAEEAKAKQAASAKPAAAAAPKAAASPAISVPAEGRTEKMSRLRQTIAKRMVQSLQTSAQLTTVVEVDVTAIAKLRAKAKADFERTHGVKLTFLPFMALATIEALKAHPVVNSQINDDNTVTYHGKVNLGIAVDTERGLLVPVVKNAEDLNISGIAKRIADLAARTRSMKIEPDEISGGTFTLTNTGSRGALFDTPIINQPQVGILGTGAIVKRAVVVQDPELGEVIVPRSMMYLALSYDHRIVDGADAARFLTTIKERLEHGAFETEVGLGQ